MAGGMYGLTFDTQAPVLESAPNRTDVACFVGFIDWRAGDVPAPIAGWLAQQGWTMPGMRSSPLGELLDVPVPVDTWEDFDRVFAWEKRPLSPDPSDVRTATTYLGAAVRSFFAQGGRKCYLIRVGEAWPLLETAVERNANRRSRLDALIPGYPFSLRADPVDQQSWRGVAHCFGLRDVSFLCLPDLPDVVGQQPLPLAAPEFVSDVPEQFIECSEGEKVTPDWPVRRAGTPRCDEGGYVAWAGALRLVADMLTRYEREVQLVASVPIPQAGSSAEDHLLRFLVDNGRGPLARSPQWERNGLSSAFVQLVYPWVRTAGSDNLPEQLEGPDGVLVGLLARNALLRGAFRSAGHSSLADVYDLHPQLSREEIFTAVAADPARNRSHALWQRVSLFGPTPDGLRLLSDVTTSLDDNYRSANVNRLVSLIVQAARRVGQDLVFEVSGQQAWARLRRSLERLLFQLLQVGALRGRSPEEAFAVRCDRTTMTQNDIDNGRLICEIQFEAAAAIERITVVLALDEGGQVSLVGTALPTTVPAG
jgi:uncharacterized protein